MAITETIPQQHQFCAKSSFADRFNLRNQFLAAEVNSLIAEQSKQNFCLFMFTYACKDYIQ